MPAPAGWAARAALASVVLAAALLTAGPAGAAAELVVDLNRSPENHGSYDLAPYPSSGVEHDGFRFFPAADLQHGHELWRTDGTAEGTLRLTDLCPGACGGGGAVLGLFAERILFLANTERGTEVWSTDGAPGGEGLVADLCPGPCTSTFLGWTAAQGQVWIVSDLPGQAPRLWRGDGVPGGASSSVSLCDDLGICGFGEHSGAYLWRADPGGRGVLLFVDSDGSYLYRTDGTREGTVRLARFEPPGAAGPAGRQALAPARRPGVRPFAAPVAAETAGPAFFYRLPTLWRTDGTPEGTRPVRDLTGLVDYPWPQDSRTVDGVFYAIFQNGDWLRSDGTAEGTVVLARVASQFRPTLAVLDGVVHAVTADGIWRTGGTPATTVKVAPFRGDVLMVIEQPERLFVMSWGHGGEIWVTDGTAAGTHQVPFPAGDDADTGLDQYEVGAFAGGVLVSRDHHQVWKVDPAGTGGTLVRDFRPANGSSGPHGQIRLGDRLLFHAQDQPYRARYFLSDGTAAGTRLLTARTDEEVWRDSNPLPHRFTAVGDRVYFSRFSDLFVTDGTDAGTRLVTRRVGFAPIAALGSTAIFAGTVSSGPYYCPPDVEPWRTAGTEATTRQILDLNPFEGPYSGSQCDPAVMASFPGPGIALGGRVLFAANDLIHGRELFATDGTAAGTVLVADIDRRLMANDVSPDPDAPERVGRGSDPAGFVRLGSQVLFAATTGAHGRELWSTDGTRRGTRRVADVVAGSVGSEPRHLTVVGDVAYFVGRHGAGDGLYRTDGTAAGTLLVHGLRRRGPGQASSLVAVGNRLYLTVFHQLTGTELWTSLGTAASTRLVADLRPGSRGSAPQHLTAVRGRLVFAADDGETGLEPWTSDGTAAGTRPLGDLADGAAASSPGPFTVVGPRVLFGADDGVHGRELWAIPVADVRAD